MKSNVKWNRAFQIIYPLAVYFVFYNVISALLYLLLQSYVSQLFCMMLSAIITSIILYRIYLKLPHPKKNIQLKAENKEDAILNLQDIFWISIIIIVGILINVIVNKTPLLGYFESYQTANQVLYSGSLLTKILCNAIFVPILEELTFRGIVFGQLEIWYGGIWPVIISALLFGIMHFNIIQFTYAFIMGILLAFSYRKSQKIYIPMLAHGLTNLAVILFL